MMHIHSMKEETKDKLIRPLKDAPVLYVPLLENFGNKPEPVVKPGDKVKKYQVIAKAKEGYSAKVHSPVSGTVSAIEKQLQADGKEAVSVIIENDYLDTIEIWKEGMPHEYSTDELLEIIEDAGIVGLGGAQFPTATKFRVEDKEIKTFIINGAECEPYLTADYAIMAEKTEELFEAIHISNRIIRAGEVIIGIERQNQELKEAFAPLLKKEKYRDYRVEVVSDEYPQGGELQLTKSLTGIEVPNDKLTADYGVIMSNIGTLYAIYQAVVNHKPLIDRIVTISGEKSDHYGNYEVKIGTPVSHILDTIEYKGIDPMIIMGGPMMGKYIYDQNTPVHKGAGGVLMLKKRDFKRISCIGCGYCVDVCPMFLMPMKYEEHYRKGKYRKLEKYNIDDCIDCGSCEYICPCNVPLMKSIQKGKSKLKELKDETR